MVDSTAADKKRLSLAYARLYDIAGTVTAEDEKKEIFLLARAEDKKAKIADEIRHWSKMTPEEFGKRITGIKDMKADALATELERAGKLTKEFEEYKASLGRYATVKKKLAEWSKKSGKDEEQCFADIMASALALKNKALNEQGMLGSAREFEDSLSHPTGDEDTVRKKKAILQITENAEAVGKAQKIWQAMPVRAKRAFINEPLQALEIEGSAMGSGNAITLYEVAIEKAEKAYYAKHPDKQPKKPVSERTSGWNAEVDDVAKKLVKALAMGDKEVKRGDAPPPKNHGLVLG
jgi:hypothetical protein